MFVFLANPTKKTYNVSFFLKSTKNNKPVLIFHIEILQSKKNIAEDFDLSPTCHEHAW